MSAQCTYCEREATTRDHIPPENLFAPPRPTLITVPCCRPCNQDAALDDEYFRLMIATRADVAEHASVQRLESSIHRSLERSSGVRGLLYRDVERHLGSEGHLSEALSSVDLPRIRLVAQRIVKGLFFHEFSRVLPSGYDAIAVEVPSHIERIPTHLHESGRTLRDAASSIRALPQHNIGDGRVFHYHVQRLPDDGDATHWLLVFFETFSCLGITKLRTGA